MKILIALIVITLYLLLYAMCRASSYDERERERMARTWEEEKYK